MKKLHEMSLILGGHKYDVVLMLGEYQSDKTQMAIIAEDKRTGEDVAVLTVCLPDHKLPPNYVAIKDYSENQGVLKQLVKEGVIDWPAYESPSGYVNIPICKLKMKPVCPPISPKPKVSTRRSLR